MHGIWAEVGKIRGANSTEAKYEFLHVVLERGSCSLLEQTPCAVQETERQHLPFYTKQQPGRHTLWRLEQAGDIRLGKEQADLKKQKLSVATAVCKNVLLAELSRSSLCMNFIDIEKSFC